MTDDPMMSKEARLMAAFAADAAPAHDPVFADAVARRLGRRRLLEQALDLAPAIVAAGALAIALLPALTILWSALSGLVGVSPAMLASLVAACGAAATTPLFLDRFAASTSELEG